MQIDTDCVIDVHQKIYSKLKQSYLCVVTGFISKAEWIIDIT